MLNYYVEEISKKIISMIDSEWELISFFYSSNKTSSSFVFYYGDEKENIRFPKDAHESNRNKIKRRELYILLEEFQKNYNNNNQDEFYGFELIINSDMSFKMAFYYDELKKLDPSFSVMLWEYVKFNGAKDSVKFILEIENIKIEDLPFQ